MASAIDYQAIFEHGLDAMVVLDRDLRCIACNRAYLRVTRLRWSDLEGRLFVDAFPPDPADPDNANRRRLRACLEEVLATRAPVAIPLIPYRATHTPILGDDGEVAMIVQHLTDVTELELEAALPRLQGLVDQAPGFVAVLRGPMHVCELANRSLVAGLGGRELLGKAIVDAVPELAGQELLAILDRTYATGTTYVGRDLTMLVQRGPTPRLTEAHLDIVCQPIRDHDEVAGVLILAVEITEQVRLQRERRAMVELVPAFVWEGLPDGKVVFVNDRTIEYFGASEEQFLKGDWLSLVAPEDRDRVIEVWTHAMQAGEPYEVHVRLRRGDGVYRWCLTRAIPVRDDTGTIRSWLGAGVDVDNQVRAREELEQRAAYEKQLIGIVSHDLRNPLAAITVSAAMALENGALPDVAARALARISSSAARATRLVRDFLDLAQVRTAGIPLRPAVTDLRELVRQVVDELRPTSRGREIRLDLDGEEVAALCDGDRVAQVLGNLIANAIQHGASGRPIDVSLRRTASAVEVAVHNDGAPIPPAETPHLFAPFWRSKSATSSGYGLGLYIAHEIIAAHGGQLIVRSSAEEGTTFTICLPSDTLDRGATWVAHA